MTEEERLLRQYNPTLRERVEGGIYDIGGLLGADPRSTLMRNIAGSAGGLLDFIPGVGDYVGGEEAYRDYKSGDYFNAGIGAAATAAGLVPGIGDALGKVLKNLKAPDYSGSKIDKPLSELEIKTTDAGVNNPRKVVNIEDLYGKVLMPLYGDRSAGGLFVDEIDGVKLRNPVYLEGGADFMVGPASQKDNSVWASDQGVVTRITDRARQLAEETGRDVAGVTIAMAPDAIDFSTFAPALLSEQMPSAKVLKKDQVDFDRAMKAVVPDWPGVMSDELTNYLYGTKSAVRKLFVDSLDKAKRKAQGFPDPGKARYAATDAYLRERPTFSAGMAIGQFDTSAKPLLDPTVPHSTYKSQIKGEYLGGLPETVHHGILFRDAYEAMDQQLDKRGKLLGESNKKYSMDRKLPGQIVDEDLINRVNAYIKSQEQ